MLFMEYRTESGPANPSLGIVQKSIENSSAGSGKIWLEDILDEQFKSKYPDTKFIYD